MNLETIRLVTWCAQECEWQYVGPLKVGYMVEAYFLLSNQNTLAPYGIRLLGHIIEPDLNPKDSWRRVNVSVGLHHAPDWREVPRLMEQFLHAEVPMSPEDLFREFEEIHPFRDGNGRIGALLYNWWNGNMEPMKLEYPPNLWGDPRRDKVLS